ncbi:ABC transporter substrate-binding protein [Paenibacillus sp. NEAU-GSW1]|uniref:ABC transporter substrate-binding protein n=1 Tax=Paenibacillus sp. NEAU-GSW1 TaxID=2682486 RepID=UPI0012E161E7|nr:extracellular solute-binding protein [Paenibacillus sp. NEAU-GSW1]MUT67337.1 extracellular solute-binding protein [Paenibacillus sp. NEAU-GSW1]
MKHTKKMLFLLMALALVFVAACGNNNGSNAENAGTGEQAGSSNSGDKQVTLRMSWWGGEPRHEYTKKVIELYQSKNPNVKVEVEYANYDDYWKKIAPQAAANELPDIMQIDTAYYAQYAGKGQLEDLTPYFGKQIDVTNISENALSAGKLGDGNFGMNLGVNSLGFQYDPALLKQAGVDSIPENWTWDQYTELAAKAKAAGLYFDTGMRAEVFFGYYLRTQGKTLYNADGNGLGYDDDKLFVDFFGRLAELVKSGSVPTPDVLAQIKGIEDDLTVKQKAIGIWQWSNQFAALQQVANRPLEFAPMVGPEMKKGLYLKPSMFFSISKNSKVKEEAAKFIDFWINDVEANKLILGERGVPVSSVIKEELKPLLTPAQQQVFDYVAWSETNSSPMDPVDPIGSAEVFASLKSVTEAMNYGQMSAEDAAAKFRKDAESVLSKNK